MRNYFGILDSVTIIRSEEHTSELQSHLNLVCRLLLEKKKIMVHIHMQIHRTRDLQPIHSITTRVKNISDTDDGHEQPRHKSLQHVCSCIHTHTRQTCC